MSMVCLALRAGLWLWIALILLGTAAEAQEPQGRPDPESVADSPSPNRKKGRKAAPDRERTGRPGAGAPSAGDAAGDLPDSVDIADLKDLLATPIEVTIASKTVETIEEAPAIVVVVSDLEIQQWGYRSVGEVLQYIVGFYLLDDHILPALAVRGTSGGLGSESSLIKIMIDGRSVSYRYTSGNWLGVELIPLSLVKRIEIVRGPASALYGADAFLGVINIVTREPGRTYEGDVRGQLVSTGAQLGYRYDVAGGSTFKRIVLMAGVAGEQGGRSGLTLPGSSPAPTIPTYHLGDDVATGLDRSSTVWYAKAGYKKDKQNYLLISGYGSYISRGGDFSRWSQLSHGEDSSGRFNETRVELSQHRIALMGSLAPHEKLDLSLGISFFLGGPGSDDHIEVGSDLYWVKRRNSYMGAEGQLEAHWQLLDTLILVGGTELIVDHEDLMTPLRINKQTGQILSGQGAGSEDRTIDLVNPGAYLQLHWTAYKQYLKLTGGIRYDYHTIYGNQVTGRAAVVSRLTDKLFLKALYGSAFMAPSPELLYAQPLRPGDIIGNENLRPQFVHTFELQAKYTPHRYLALSTDLAYNLVQDKAEFVPQKINKAAQNIAEVQTLSWESAATVRYRDILSCFVGFELLHTMREQGEQGYLSQLLGSHNVVYPPWILRGGISFKTPNISFPLQLFTTAMLVPEHWASGDNIFNMGAPYELPTYVMWNAGLSLSTRLLLKGRESRIGINAYNLLGATGPDPGFGGIDYPLPPREIMFTLRQEI